MPAGGPVGADLQTSIPIAARSAVDNGSSIAVWDCGESTCDRAPRIRCDAPGLFRAATSVRDLPPEQGPMDSDVEDPSRDI